MPGKIGRFEILGEITRSSAACVYKASDPDNGQTVALKTASLEAMGADAPAMVQRLLEEAESTKVLNSQNIVLLYGAGEIDGQFCAALEYVQGNSIATMLARKDGFSIWDLQDITRQACQALDHAHARKVIHYSLEPGKIMVSWDGTVKVLGFGISAMGASAAQASGKPPESLRYMPPEQLRGEPLDARSNLFTMGAILYEMITDRKAFGGDDAEQVRQQILSSMPVPPALIIPKIPPGLSDIVMKALSKAPDQRYSSGKDLVTDLEECNESSAKSSAAKPAIAPKPAEARAWNAPAESSVPAETKAAAAAAGWAGSSEESSPHGLPQPGLPQHGLPSQRGAAAMSAAAPAETELQSPLAVPPPMIANAGDAAAKRKSFSDVAELPPLKEIYIKPPEPPAEAEPEPAVSEPPVTVFQPGAKVEKAKVPASEVAKQVVREIGSTPPKLFIYAIAGAVVIILLVVAGIYSRIHSQNPDEGQPPAVEQTGQAAPRQPAGPGHAATAAPESTPVEASRESRNADTSVITVTPRHVSKKKAEKTPPPAPVIIPGQLTVNSSPEGAQVLVDGHHDPSWVTPYNMAGLAPGQHIVSVSKMGYSPETRNIDVSSGSKSFLAVELVQLGGAVSANTEPDGAELFLDGKDTGRKTPAQVQIDHPGVHTVMVRKAGYLDESSSFNLPAGQTFQYAPVLRALGVTDDIRIGSKLKKVFGGGETAGMASVSVKTQPKGAQIAVNHHVLDKGSPVEFLLNPGTYVIDITLSGFKSAQRVITVEKNGKASVDETLERQ